MQNSQTAITSNDYAILGNIAKIKNGYAYKRLDIIKSVIPLIRQSNLDGERVNLAGCVYLPKEHLEKYKQFALKKGDVLLGMSGSLGKLCIYDLDTPALQNQRTGKVDITHPEKVNEKYFWYFLNTIESRLIAISKGTGINNISATDIESLDLYLPNKNEQELIVTKLDHYIPKVNESKDKIARAKQLINKFRQSVLSAAVTGKLTEGWKEKNNQPEWIETSVKEIAKDITYGYTASSTVQSVGPKFLRITDIQDNKVEWETVPYCKIDEDKIKKYQIAKGDIVFARTGATTGKSFLIVDPPNAVFASYLIRVRSNTELILPEYLYCFFQSANYWSQIMDNISGSAQPNCNATKLSSLALLLPSLNEQREIVKQTDQLLKIADTVEQQIENASNKVNKLSQSILAKAFKGELIS